MDNENIDYKKVDNGIKDLVYTLNQIPFVLSVESSSCEGHLRDDAGLGILPDEGHKFIFGGDIIFNVDKAHHKAKNFLEDVRNLGEKYQYADFSEHHCGNSECSIEGYQVLSVSYNDLTHAKRIEEEDNLATRIKKRHQIKTSIGKQRISEYHIVWDDFLEIARKYVE